jgi:hypothetical protein
MINAKKKGARGERLWRDELRIAGFTQSARDGQQGGGVNNGGYHPDVLCPELPYLHSETKFVQSLNIRAAMSQSISDAGPDRVPIVAHKRKNEEWLVTMLADDWLQLVHSGSAYLK